MDKIIVISILLILATERFDYRTKLIWYYSQMSDEGRTMVLGELESYEYRAFKKSMLKQFDFWKAVMFIATAIILIFIN